MDDFSNDGPEQIERFNALLEELEMTVADLIAKFPQLSAKALYKMRSIKIHGVPKSLIRVLANFETPKGVIKTNWLLTGRGSMFEPVEQDWEKSLHGSFMALYHSMTGFQRIAEDLQENDGRLQDQLGRLELKIGQSSTDLKNQVAYQGQQISELKAHLSLDEEPEEEPEEIETLQYVGFVGAAGIPEEWDTIEDTIEVPVSLLPRNRKDLFVGNVQGDSMKDIIPDGADVLLRVCNSPLNGRVYVFSLRGTATIKKFRLDENGPHFEYMDGSGRIIYPEKGEKWFCNAEFLGVVRNNEHE